MSAEGIATTAGALANGTRAAFCDALLDGRAWSLSELARHAGVSMPTASEHATVLVQAGLCREDRRGRSRYIELADERVAACIEELASLAPHRPAPASGLKAVTKREALARGRTCYDHLAGRLGVAVTDALRNLGVLDETLAVSPEGLGWIERNLDGPVATGRRPLARQCLDWTERRPHLAGAAGAHICRALFERRWIRRAGAGRAVAVTPEGAERLAELLHEPFSTRGIR
ncbi:ArsR/SmtB family transcription factor [Saccharopolyspora taberi]|uniref:Winged helix-turn-helix domain-containing protein n=1 Tax=Saccharopolyspora taberi TaxID=60895 RepID=A0ABN3VCI6_9PSEU